MPDTMSNAVKPAVQYATKGKRRRQAKKALVEGNSALSRTQGLLVDLVIANFVLHLVLAPNGCRGCMVASQIVGKH